MGEPVARAVAAGDAVCLLRESEEGREKHAFRLATGTHTVRGVGLVRHESLLGRAYGTRVSFGGKEYVLLPATALDLVESVRRKAQIVLPKDSATVLLHAGIAPGSTVVEGGIGSGALTIPLAWAVGREGKVVSYELREDFRDWARENLEAAGLASRVEFKLADVTKGIAERGADAVVLDIPNPWEAVDAAREALAAGGCFASYSPLVSQVEQTVSRLREAHFVDVRVVENLQREWVIGERGSRPSHEMLGHTGFLVFARKAEGKR